MRRAILAIILFFCVFACSNNGTDTQNDPTTKGDATKVSDTSSDAGPQDTSSADLEKTDSSPDARKPAILAGDWFPCLDDACTKLYHIGERYEFWGNEVDTHAEVGRLVYLYAQKKPHDGSSYCHLTRIVMLGSYYLRKNTLIKDLDNVYKDLEGKPYTVEIVGDILERTEDGQITTQRFKRVLGQSRPCSEITDYTICPNHPIETNTDESCFASYNCATNALSPSLDCFSKEGSVTVYECTCEDYITGAKSTFDTEEFCQSGMSDVEATRFANEKCGWNILIPEMLDEQ